jgi:outer membrane protein TolC
MRPLLAATAFWLVCQVSLLAYEDRPTEEMVPPPDATSGATPIDLASALRLAGVQNLQLVIAQQRVEASVATQQLAAAQILPSLNLGGNFDSHTGDLQQASGNILTLQRSAFYVGAGANAVAAGTVSIPGLQYNINISQGIYNFLVARRRTEESAFDQRAANNSILLEVATRYTRLLQAEGEHSLAILARNDARRIAELTAAYARTGEGRRADADRAATELARREQDVAETVARLYAASHRLSEILNLEASMQLRVSESQVVPEPIVPTQIPLPELLAVALLERPELQARRTSVQAALLELGGARMLPFSPTLLAGFSSGAFGGTSDNIKPGDTSGRTDQDVVMYWTLLNMGIGNKAQIDAARARLGATQFQELAVLDVVRQEVADAYVRTHARFAEIDRLAKAVRTGSDALREDFLRVKGREGLPIELLDSLRQLAESRLEYLAAIIGFNQAELQLYVALGNPPADTLAHSVPRELVSPKESPIPTR